jgi:hypothetical protein
MQHSNKNTTTTATTATTVTTAVNNTAYGAFANYAKAQQQKQVAQQQRLANATYVLVKPSKANITRQKQGVTQAQQNAVNANLAATLVLQLYPLVAQSGLTPQQQTQVQQQLLQAVYVLQQHTTLPTTKYAVQLQLPPLP